MEYIGDRASPLLSGECQKYLPTLVTGDMDSILPDLLEKLKQTTSRIIYTPDIMETDYTKALMQLGQYLDKHHTKVFIFFFI